MFLTAISEYDQVLAEDLRTNRMQESVNLFSTILNYQWFQKTPIVLFPKQNGPSPRENWQWKAPGPTPFSGMSWKRLWRRCKLLQTTFSWTKSQPGRARCLSTCNLRHWPQKHQGCWYRCPGCHHEHNSFSHCSNVSQICKINQSLILNRYIQIAFVHLYIVFPLIISSFKNFLLPKSPQINTLLPYCS